MVEQRKNPHPIGHRDRLEACPTAWVRLKSLSASDEGVVVDEASRQRQAVDGVAVRGRVALDRDRFVALPNGEEWDAVESIITGSSASGLAGKIKTSLLRHRRRQSMSAKA